MKFQLPSWLGGKGLQTRSGVEQLFGSIAKNQWPIRTWADFIPTDDRGGTTSLDGTDVSAVWTSLQTLTMQHWAYIYCSPLAAVIDRLASADTNGKVAILMPDGKKVAKNSKVPSLYRVMKLLKKPNPSQTWEEFNAEQIVLCKKHGYCPVFGVCPVGFDKTWTKSLWNIDPAIATPIYRENYSLYDDIDDNERCEIEYWRFTIQNEEYTIPDSDIILIKDGFSRDHKRALPMSKVAGLDYAISNICAAMEADNVLLRKKGPLGIFSHDPKPDPAGWQPLEPEDKDDLEKDLQRYGLTWGKLQYIVSKTPVRWNAMSFNLRDLMTKETVRQGVDSICDRFDYPAELMSGKNATYENRSSAEKFLYQNNVIPFAERRMALYNQYFGFDEEEYRLVKDFDHIAVLQEDVVKASSARYATSQALTLDWQAGAITLNEYRLALKMDKLPSELGDLYYHDYIKKYPPPVKPASNEAQAPARKPAQSSKT